MVKNKAVQINRKNIVCLHYSNPHVVNSDIIIGEAENVIFDGENVIFDGEQVISN